MAESWRYIIAALVALILLAIPVTSAQAAPIRECGNMSDVNVENLTTRNVDCRSARWFAVDYQRSGRVPSNAYPRGMRIVSKRTYRGRGKYTVEDIRFSNGSQVIRYQSLIDD